MTNDNNISKTILSKVITTEFADNSDEQLIEETATPNSILTASQEKYLDNSCAVSKQTGLIDENAVEDNSWLIFNDEGDAILKPKLITLNNTGTIITETVNKQRSEIIFYTVEMGDTVSTIARKFNISVNTIIWANDLNSYGFIKPGNRLTILPYSGIIYTVKSGDTLSKIATKYNIDAAEIISCNNFGNSLKIGQKIIVPGAKKLAEAAPVSQAVRNYTGLSIIKDIIKPTNIPVSGSRMVWPTQGHNISQYYSWRHTGVDIANHVGTPVYAADSGTVIIAANGWNGGYGKTIVIDHGNGKKTRYGHSSQLLVKVGDEVEKGQEIMLMGSTGNSTGPHLHFELFVNGSRTNPLNYIR